jgi:hypothetical protein
MNSNDCRPRRATSYARSAEPNPCAIAQQHARNLACAAREGYLILPEHCYSDDGVGGHATTRPALDHLLADLAQADGSFDRIYQTDRTRLTRAPDPLQHVECRSRIERLGVRLCFSGHVSTLIPPQEGVR